MKKDSFYYIINEKEKTVLCLTSKRLPFPKDKEGEDLFIEKGIYLDPKNKRGICKFDSMKRTGIGIIVISENNKSDSDITIEAIKDYPEIIKDFLWNNKKLEYYSENIEDEEIDYDKEYERYLEKCGFCE